MIGTGKTATVKEVIRKLKEQSEVNDIPDFDFIEINGKYRFCLLLASRSKNFIQLGYKFK